MSLIRRAVTSFLGQSSSKTPARKAATRLGMDALEAREVPAADVLAAFNNGVLSIEGTPGNDTLVVHQVGNTIRVNGIDVRDSSDQIISVPAADLTTIKVNALEGDDVIWIKGNLPVTADLYAGAGNDLIFVGPSTQIAHDDLSVLEDVKLPTDKGVLKQLDAAPLSPEGTVTLDSLTVGSVTLSDVTATVDVTGVTIQTATVSVPDLGTATVSGFVAADGSEYSFGSEPTTLTLGEVQFTDATVSLSSETGIEFTGTTDIDKVDSVVFTGTIDSDGYSLQADMPTTDFGGVEIEGATIKYDSNDGFSFDVEGVNIPAFEAAKDAGSEQTPFELSAMIKDGKWVVTGKYNGEIAIGYVTIYQVIVTIDTQANALTGTALLKVTSLPKELVNAIASLSIRDDGAFKMYAEANVIDLGDYYELGNSETVITNTTSRSYDALLADKYTDVKTGVLTMITRGRINLPVLGDVSSFEGTADSNGNYHFESTDDPNITLNGVSLTTTKLVVDKVTGVTFTSTLNTFAGITATGTVTIEADETVHFKGTGTLAGVTLSSLALDLDYDPSLTTASAVLTGKLNVLGATVTLGGSATLVDGEWRDLAFTISAGVSVAGLTIAQDSRVEVTPDGMKLAAGWSAGALTGQGDVTIGANGLVSFAGTAKLGGFTLADASATLKRDPRSPTAYLVTLTGRVNVPGGPVIDLKGTGRVVGMNWSGQLTSTGTVPVAGFTLAQGGITLSSTGLKFDVAWNTGGVNATLDAAIAIDGSVHFSGTGSAAILGFALGAVQVTVDVNPLQSTYVTEVTGSLNVLGNTVAVGVKGTLVNGAWQSLALTNPVQAQVGGVLAKIFSGKVTLTLSTTGLTFAGNLSLPSGAGSYSVSGTLRPDGSMTVKGVALGVNQLTLAQAARILKASAVGVSDIASTLYTRVSNNLGDLASALNAASFGVSEIARGLGQVTTDISAIATQVWRYTSSLSTLADALWSITWVHQTELAKGLAAATSSLSSIATQVWSRCSGNVATLAVALGGVSRDVGAVAAQLWSRTSSLSTLASGLWSIDWVMHGELARGLTVATTNVASIATQVWRHTSSLSTLADALWSITWVHQTELAKGLAAATSSLSSIATQVWSRCSGNVATLAVALGGVSRDVGAVAAQLWSRTSSLSTLASGLWSIDWVMHGELARGLTVATTNVASIATQVWRYTSSLSTLADALWSISWTNVDHIAYGLGYVSRDIGGIATQVWRYCGGNLTTLASTLWHEIEWTTSNHVAQGLAAVTGNAAAIAQALVNVGIAGSVSVPSASITTSGGHITIGPVTVRW